MQSAANFTANAGGTRLTGTSVVELVPQKPWLFRKKSGDDDNNKNPQTQARLGGPGGIRTHDGISPADYESRMKFVKIKGLRDIPIPFRKQCTETAVEALSGGNPRLFCGTVPDKFSGMLGPAPSHAFC